MFKRALLGFGIIAVTAIVISSAFSPAPLRAFSLWNWIFGTHIEEAASSLPEDLMAACPEEIPEQIKALSPQAVQHLQLALEEMNMTPEERAQENSEDDSYLMDPIGTESCEVIDLTSPEGRPEAVETNPVTNVCTPKPDKTGCVCVLVTRLTDNILSCALGEMPRCNSIELGDAENTYQCNQGVCLESQTCVLQSNFDKLGNPVLSCGCKKIK